MIINLQVSKLYELKNHHWLTEWINDSMINRNRSTDILLILKAELSKTSNKKTLKNSKYKIQSRYKWTINEKYKSQFRRKTTYLRLCSQLFQHLSHCYCNYLYTCLPENEHFIPSAPNLKKNLSKMIKSSS